MDPKDFQFTIPCDSCEYIEWLDKNSGKTRSIYKIGFKIAYNTFRDGKTFKNVKSAYLSSRKPFEVGEVVTLQLIPSYSKESSKNEILQLTIV